LWSVERQNSERFKQSLYELSLFNEQREHVMKKFLNEPLQSTLLGFSRVTNMVRDALRQGENQQNTAASNSNEFDFTLKKAPRSASNNPTDDMSDLMDSLTADNIHSTINDGYEMVTKVDLGSVMFLRLKNSLINILI
jgi:hypothetical protein